MGRVGFIDYLLAWRRARANDRLIEDAPPTPVVLLGAVQDADTLQRVAVNANGEIAEASSASTATSVASIYTARDVNAEMTSPHFVGPGTWATAAAANREKRILSTTLTATAGGEIVVDDLMPALAGYSSCMNLRAIWSDQTDGTINLTFATTTGLVNGPGAVNIATTANQVAPDWGVGIHFRGGTANEAITVLAAAGQTVANQVFIFIGTYWYEAP